MWHTLHVERTCIPIFCMAHPKRKHSKARRDSRRAHDALKSVASIACDNCGAQKLPHRLCNACGTYRKRQVRAVRVSAE